MAELAVSIVVEKLTNILLQEASYLEGAASKVEQLKNELKYMQIFLRDADSKQESNELVRNWVSEIREVAYDAEELIETYVSRSASQTPWDSITKPLYLYKFGKKVEQISVRLEEISGRREKYGVSRDDGGGGGGDERMKWWRQPAPDINSSSDDTIELVEDTRALLAQLTSLDQRRRVVSIVGMGGLGKTTLAKKLYNHRDVKMHFNCKAWVYSSKEWSRRDILLGIIKEVNAVNNSNEFEVLERLREEELLMKLHVFLSERRYLVVLDDIWSMVVWDGIENAFPSGKSGSKVMITTRNKEVAFHADSNSIPHEPRILTESESFRLLSRKAFSEGEVFPTQLEEHGREMAIRCGGLPLAVVVLGGLLSRKMKTKDEWGRVFRNITWHLTKGEDRIAAILALSYNDLPSYLKPCFLYLGLFPEDFLIQRKKLMQLWVAEGFLPQEGEETEEGVGEKCLNELIQRCMVQVGSKGALGRVKTIRIHDLLRDLSISKGRQENFLEIHSLKKGDLDSTKARRHAIHSRYDRYAFLKPSASYSRSLLFFNRDHNLDITRKQSKISFSGEKKLDFIYKSFRVLRVLDLEGVRVVSLPSSVGDLIQLRYLGLRRTKLEEELPLSIGNLTNLQVLDLRFSCFLKKIPNVIWKMVKLQHLLLYTPFDSPDSGHLKMDTLANLQTLPYIETGSWMEHSNLVKMTNLQKLGIDGLSRQKVNDLISTLEKLRNLQSLSLLLVSEQEAFPTHMQLSRCLNLQKLSFYGKMEKVPDTRDFPPNLVKLTLYNSHLPKQSISKLERLPHLKMLVLGNGSYDWKEVVFSTGGFPELHTLRLHLLKELEEWTIEEKAVSKLEHLLINRCEKLKRIPEGLKLVTSLKELEIVGMPVEFEFKLRNDDMPTFCHMPSLKSTTDILTIGSQQRIGR